MEQKSFSYNEYKKIILKYKSIICDFRDVRDKSTFALLRHDVEFNTERALKIAEIDNDIGINSSFLFQVKSNAYNICSNENLLIIDKIRKMGHSVGLHFYVSHVEINNWVALLTELETKKEIFETSTKYEIDRFSFHRPPKWVLEKRADTLNKLINMYGPSYFEFTDKPNTIKYLADSMHRFSYGHPLDKMPFSKYQILLHPDEWTSQGLEEEINFKSLAMESGAEFRRTMNFETKNYAKYFLHEGL